MGPGQIDVMRRMMTMAGIESPARRGGGPRSFAPMDLGRSPDEAVESRVSEEAIGALAARVKGGEDWASLMLRIFALSGSLEPLLGCSKVSRYLCEFGMGQFRADLVLWHEDGGVSIVEAKGDGAVTGVVAGFGQVSMYALMYLQQCGTRPPAYLRKYVVAPIVPEHMALCTLAALSCNVQFVPLPRFEGFKDQIAALAAKACRG